MPWFKVDDGLYSHPKWLATPSAARALWVTAGSWCAAQLTDGHVPPGALGFLGARPKDARDLVHHGFWEEVTDGEGWRFHDWLEFQPSREQVEKLRSQAKRRQALNDDPELRRRIRGRDGNICRYCGTEVNWKDRRGPAGGTYDHVIPMSKGGDDSLENLVVCCRSCNSRKCDRTLAEAGMTLLPPRSDLGGITTGTKQGSKLDHENPSRPDPTHRDNPQPHAERGEPTVPQQPDHHGQHPNCRACGTNPRAQGTNQRGPKPPDPAERTAQAATAEMERNAARARGDACDTCAGAMWLDTTRGPDGYPLPPAPCPDCNDEARTA